ncbi:MAG: tetratricopeptide repeat protein [Clostridia bacterium]|nr:tetratricopeptide repeat protein [Clostridia bacterium]
MRKKGKVEKIDYDIDRLGFMADKYYNEGKFLSALRFAYRQYELCGGDGDIFTRLADIYEGMGLHASAINWLYKYMDVGEEQDFPEIFESLAVNYLNMGQENCSAYYYNRLIDVDESLPIEAKQDILDVFSKPKNAGFRFVYPPEAADYSKELDAGSRALKAGDCKRAVEMFRQIEKGSKQYAQAKEMQAVAHLLAGEEDEAERICLELLETKPEDTRALATLSAVYLEQEKKEESQKIALKLYESKQDNSDDLYKVATVCCENGLHEQAFEKFCELEKLLPFDGRMLYFKAVAAYKCGKLEESEKAFDVLCGVYPDAEVAKYYLRALRRREVGETLNEADAPDYLYHLPKAERESRCRSLLQIGSCPKDEAQLFGLIALHDGYFRWCFDEMDGADHDLQYLGIVTAVHVRADDFLRDVLLDCEVVDVLKVETLRLLYERNEDMNLGLVLSHIYRRLRLRKIKIGRKKRKRFLAGYAKIASRFVAVHFGYSETMKNAAENLYAALEEREKLDLIEKEDDVACAIYLLSRFKELGNDLVAVAKAFDANVERVAELKEIAIDRYEAVRGE